MKNVAVRMRERRTRALTTSIGINAARWIDKSRLNRTAAS